MTTMYDNLCLLQVEQHRRQIDEKEEERERKRKRERERERERGRERESLMKIVNNSV